MTTTPNTCRLCICDNCGKEYQVTKKTYSRALQHFCSRHCHSQYMAIYGYGSKKLQLPFLEGEVKQYTHGHLTEKVLATRLRPDQEDKVNEFTPYCELWKEVIRAAVRDKDIKFFHSAHYRYICNLLGLDSQTIKYGILASLGNKE